jgi:hypothetical protein
VDLIVRDVSLVLAPSARLHLSNGSCLTPADSNTLGLTGTPSTLSAGGGSAGVLVVLREVADF